MSNPPLLIERRAQQAFSMTTTKAHYVSLGRELAVLLGEDEITCSVEGPHAYMAPGVDPSHLVSEVVTILGAAGGLGGIAAVLKVFFSRHKGTTVKFGKGGEVLQADGLSVDDIIRLLDKCSPRTPPDLVVRDARNACESEEPGPDLIVQGEEFERAMSEARQRSLEGPPKEVVVYADGEHRVIRRYEDGHEVPRRPDCPSWCEQNHDGPHGLRVWHHGKIGTIALPDGAEVSVGIIGDPAGRNLVTVGGWAPHGPYLKDAFRSSLTVPAKDAIQLAGVAELLGHADLAGHLKSAAATITAGPAAGGSGQCATACQPATAPPAKRTRRDSGPDDR